MTRIIVDDVLRSKLHNLTEPLDLCDESGRVLARVTPQLDLSKYGPKAPPISEEELGRREKSDKWYTTEQVLKHLHNLEKQ
jgi:hypothetical protein